MNGKRVSAAPKSPRRTRPSSPAEVELERRAGVAARHQRVGEIEWLQQLERARLHRGGPRLVRAVERTIDDAERHAERSELRREREPRRPRADDQRVQLDLYQCGGLRPHGPYIRCHRPPRVGRGLLRPYRSTAKSA